MGEVPFNTIEILKDENRSPFSLINKLKTDVSITHSSSVALSTVMDKTIDLESKRTRTPSFIDESFSSAEIEWFKLYKADDELITMFWTMKESHLKRMRIGLKTDLHDVLIDKLEKLEENNFTSIVISPQGKSKCVSYIGQKHVVTVAQRFQQFIE